MATACSFVEESNADKAIKALTAALAPKARVKRNGKVESVEAKELVPGDIVIIQFGNIVPADVKLLGKSGSDEVPMQVGISCLRASAPHSRSSPNLKHSAEISPQQAMRLSAWDSCLQARRCL